MRGYLALVVASISCGDNLHLTGSDGLNPGDAASNPDAPGTADASTDAPPEGPPDLGDGSTSGTRLKLVWYVTENGVKSYLNNGPGFYDSQRGEDCGAVRWSDGNWYCSPAALQGFYSDATCTTVIGRWFTSTCATSPSSPPPYITENAVDCTRSEAHLYQRGAPVTPAQVYSHNSVTGACTRSFISSTDEYYAIGPEVATTDLVQMTSGAPQGTGTIQLEWWQTTDGLHSIFRPYDSSLDVECVLRAAYSGAPACLPQSARSVVYGDASCTEREVALPTSCPAPPYSFAIDNGACPKPTLTFFTTGPAVTATPLYWFDGSDTCNSSTPIAADTYYSVGAQVTPTPLQYVTDTTPGRRLELHHFTATDFTYRDRYLYDTTVGGDCQLQRTGDGSAACVPFNRVEVSLWETETGVVDAFSDAACTMPLSLVQVYNGDPTCDAITPPGFAVRMTMTNGCVASEVHKTGAAYTGPVYDNTFGSCYLWSDSRFAFYDGSTIIPNSSLATATRVVDP